MLCLSIPTPGFPHLGANLGTPLQVTVNRQVKGQNDVIRVATYVVLLLLALVESTQEFQMNLLVVT